jgi:arylformamidase
LYKRKTLEADGVEVSDLTVGVHTGTHVDAPSHFIAGATTVDGLSLDVLTGLARVVEVPITRHVSGKVLESCNVPTGTERLLLKTENSRRRLMEASKFTESFAALTPDGALWIRDRGIRLIGVDYLSVQHNDGSSFQHSTMLEQGIVIVEGLKLTDVLPGNYILYCLPMLLRRAEAAPARAILVSE